MNESERFKAEILKGAAIESELGKIQDLQKRIDSLQEQKKNHLAQLQDVQSQIEKKSAEISEALSTGKSAEALIQKRATLRGLALELEALPAEIEDNIIPAIEAEILALKPDLEQKLGPGIMAVHDELERNLSDRIAEIENDLLSWAAAVRSVQSDLPIQRLSFPNTEIYLKSRPVFHALRTT
jgi:chromosome segregation ATPase